MLPPARWSASPDWSAPGGLKCCPAIFGIESPISGEVTVAGRRLDSTHCRDAIDAGMAMVPEDRKQQGLILEMGIRTNIGLPGLARHKKAGVFLNRAQERRDSDRMIERNENQDPQRHATGTIPLRRKPAEGRNRQMVVDESESPAAR